MRLANLVFFSLFLFQWRLTRVIIMLRLLSFWTLRNSLSRSSLLLFLISINIRRVHISEDTLSFLNGEFEVTDGDGASREETIRLSGIKTFFIVRVLKPVSYSLSSSSHLLSTVHVPNYI